MVRPTRREVLQVGAVAGLGLGLAGNRPVGATARDADVNCILLFLVGGPSQLDTWDPKPDAPEEVRGPFRPIATAVPGLRISEVFPRLARQMDRVALVRTVYHRATAVHDAGHQMMQTGRLFGAGVEHPHYGSVFARLKGPRDGIAPHVLLPRPIGPTGGNMPHGQSAGYLGPAFDPIVLDGTASDLEDEPRSIRDRYGATPFGRDCLRARRLVERGVRFVTVNMFETVFHATTWDCHGAAPFSTIADTRDEVGPSFDAAYSALIEDLDRRGMLERTLVLAFGEFGRTPRINPSGGRDHHPGCWTVLFAGGGVRGGQAVGVSDAIGAAPKDRPVSTAEIAATVYHGLGIDPGTEFPGPDGRPIRLVERDIDPVLELF